MIISRSPFIDQLASRYGGTCQDCGCPYAEGQQVLWQPRVGTKAKVTHIPGECGGSYSVKAVYHATSKVLTLSAFSAEGAMDLAHAKLTRTVSLPHPCAYICYQGHIVVATRIVEPTRRKVSATLSAVIGRRA